LTELRETTRREMRADKEEFGRLTEHLYQEHTLAMEQLRSAATATQIEDKTSIYGNELTFKSSKSDVHSDLNKSMSKELERKLRDSNLTRERAERQCSMALKEIEAQKKDIIALTIQLQQAKTTPTELNLDQRDSPNIRKMQNLLSQKEGQLRGLRESLVKLKAEFVASEKAHASASTAACQARTQNGGGDDVVMNLRSRANELTHQLHLCRGEAKTAMCKNEVISSQRDKYKIKLDHALVQVETLRCNSVAIEARCRELDDALAKARSECSELRDTEIRLRRKLCEGGGTTQGTTKELEVLRAQNLALRKAHDSFVHTSGDRNPGIPQKLVARTCLHVRNNAQQRSPQFGVVKYSKPGIIVPLSRSELVTKLKLENQALKMSLGEREIGVARQRLKDHTHVNRSKYSKRELKEILHGLRLLTHRQNMDLLELKVHAKTMTGS